MHYHNGSIIDFQELYTEAGELNGGTFELCPQEDWYKEAPVENYGDPLNQNATFYPYRFPEGRILEKVIATQLFPPGVKKIISEYSGNEEVEARGVNVMVGDFSKKPTRIFAGTQAVFCGEAVSPFIKGWMLEQLVFLTHRVTRKEYCESTLRLPDGRPLGRREELGEVVNAMRLRGATFKPGQPVTLWLCNDDEFDGAQPVCLFYFLSLPLFVACFVSCSFP